jgi:hypothetical protein
MVPAIMPYFDFGLSKKSLILILSKSQFKKVSELNFLLTCQIVDYLTDVE